MAKKDLTKGMLQGIASLAKNPTPEPEEQAAPAPEPQPETPEPAAPKKSSRKKVQLPSSSLGLRAGYTRATIIAKELTIAKVREIAYLERALVMDIYEEALADFIEKYEAEHGRVRLPKPRPKKK